MTSRDVFFALRELIQRAPLRMDPLNAGGTRVTPVETVVIIKQHGTTESQQSPGGDIDVRKDVDTACSSKTDLNLASSSDSAPVEGFGDEDGGVGTTAFDDGAQGVNPPKKRESRKTTRLFRARNLIDFQREFLKRETMAKGTLSKSAKSDSQKFLVEDMPFTSTDAVEQRPRAQVYAEEDDTPGHSPTDDDLPHNPAEAGERLERQRRSTAVKMSFNRSRHRYMMRHSDTIRIMWDLFTVMLLCYLGVALPFHFGFDCGDQSIDPSQSNTRGCLLVTFPSMLWFWETFIDLFFVLDIVLNFRTSYIDSTGAEVFDPYMVARHYLSTWFALDVVSSIPLDLIIFLAVQDANTEAGTTRSFKLLKSARMMKVLKLVRFTKLVKFLGSSVVMDKVEEIAYSSSMAIGMQVFRLLFTAFYTCHVLGCLWAAVDTVDKQGWGGGYTDFDDGQVEDDSLSMPYDEWNKKDVHRKYIVCVYWAMTTITTVG